MNKSRFIGFIPLWLVLACGIASAGPISLGSILTNNIAVLGFDSLFPSSSTILVTNTTSHINITGNVVAPVVSNAAGITFAGGSSAITSGAVLTNGETDLASLVTQLNALSYSALTITNGGTTNISAPGDYTITGTLGAGTIINLTGSGPYVFKTTGSTNLALNGVTINGNATLSSDSVFWYSTGAVSVTNSKVFGDLVEGSHANDIIQTASGLTGSLTGRFLSEGFDTSLTSVGSSTLNINDFQAGIPEPSTLLLLFVGLGGLAATAIRRRR